MSLEDEGIFVRYVKFPPGVRAVTLSNKDGTVDVYINESLCDARKEKALRHELMHIKGNHLWLERPVTIDEQIAEDG